MRGQFTVMTLGRPAPAPCVYAQCTEVGDVHCDLCNAQVCPRHSYHLLMKSPYQRLASHKIVCPSCRLEWSAIAAEHHEDGERLAFIPRAELAEVDPSRRNEILEAYETDAAHGR